MFARLIGADVLAGRKVGRTRLIRGNEDGPLVAPLREILLVAAGPVVALAEELAAVPGVDRAFLYGSFAARVSVPGAAPADLDLMVIGSPDPVPGGAAAQHGVVRFDPLGGHGQPGTVRTAEPIEAGWGSVSHKGPWVSGVA